MTPGPRRAIFELPKRMNPEHIAGGIERQLEARGGGARPEADAPRPPPRVPDHELLQRIGAGSYGDVWLARSVTGQLRAVKVVWRRNFSSERPYEREFRGIVQFEPISRSHRGVINILHVGRDDSVGCFFYVMELADSLEPLTAIPVAAGGDRALPDEARGRAIDPEPGGFIPYVPRTLAVELKLRGRLPLVEVLMLGVQLADALGHLHRHGLVHRDVKPSNVIFVHGQPKLADIGLVTSVSEAQTFVGTEGFIPPEGPGTERADLFSLGRLLYEGATGKDRCDFPELPADLDHWPADRRHTMLELNEILAKLCAPVAGQRHRNAAELAGELNLILAGRSVRRAYQVERRLRRAVWISLGALGVLAVAAATLWIQGAQRRQAEARANSEALLRRRAERAEQEGREQLRESLHQQALALATSGDVDRRTRALAALRQAAAIRPGPDLRDAAATAFAAPELRTLRQWKVETNGGVNTTFDAQLQRYVRVNPDGTISLHACADDRELIRLPAVEASLSWARFSPDGRWLGVHYRDDTFRVWDLQRRAVTLRQSAAVTHAFSRDGRYVAVSCRAPHLHLFDAASGRSLWQTPLRAGIDSLDFHPSLPLLVACSRLATNLQIYSVTDGHLDREVPVPALGIVARWTPGGKRLIVGHADFAVRVWDWADLSSPHLVIRFHRSEPAYLAVDPGDRWLATAGWDNAFGLFDLRDGRQVLSTHASGVLAATDRPVLAYLNESEWTLAEFDPAIAFETLDVHEQHKSPRPLAFSPDGRWLATGGGDGVRLIRVRDRQIGTLVTNLECIAVGFSADSRRLFAMGTDGAEGWEIGPDARDAPTAWNRIPLPPALVGARAVGAVASFGSDHRRWIVEARRGRPDRWGWVIGDLEGSETRFDDRHVGKAESPDLSPDRHWLAWGNWQDRDAHVLDLTSDTPPRKLTIAGSASARFSPDGRLLFLGGSRALRLLETGTWRELRSIPRDPPGSLPPLVAFAPDSRSCAVVLPPNEVLLTDTETGRELIRLRPSALYLLHQPVFSPDGRMLAVTSTDHHLLIWNLGELRARLAGLGLDWSDPARADRN